jgi:hypothetical protein
MILEKRKNLPRKDTEKHGIRKEVSKAWTPAFTARVVKSWEANQRINIRCSIKQGAGFIFCSVSELAELDVISCSGSA